MKTMERLKAIGFPLLASLTLVMIGWAMIACGGPKGAVTEGDTDHPVVVTYTELGYYERYFYNPDNASQIAYKERRDLKTDSLLARILVENSKNTVIVYYEENEFVVKIDYLNPKGDVEKSLDLITKIGVEE